MKRRDTKRFPPPGELIELGGYRLHLYCTGNGEPTVVLEAGLGDSSMVWARVQEQVAETTRVCSFDHAGLGWSDPGPKPRSFDKVAGELRTLLRTAGEQPPYVLVGHSSGAHTVRLFAAAYPEAVAGGTANLQGGKPSIRHQFSPAPIGHRDAGPSRDCSALGRLLAPGDPV